MTESDNEPVARTRDRTGTALRRKYRPVCVRGLASVGLVTGALALASPEALAITKDQCVDANTRAQSLRREGKLVAAREQLRLCIDSQCPGIVRDDCSQRLDELERAQPTIVLDAKSVAGDDISFVHVAVDGAPLTDLLDGRALAVDPGQHVFRFEVPGHAPTEYRFVLKEGEKDRRERIVLSGAAEPVPPGAGSAAEPPRGQSQRVAAIAFGAAGLAGLGVGAVFGVLTIRDWSNSQSESECASPTQCPNHPAAVADHDRAETAGTISTVAFIAGGALLATGLVTWLTSPSSGLEPAHASARLSPAVGPGLAGVSVTGSF
jgi:hypothetical protein